MPSTFTPQLRFTQQADGENPSTWGDIQNTNHTLIEQAIAGLTTIPLTTGTTTLTTANGASDQARAAILNLTGALSGNVLLVIPNLAKWYIVFNNTSNAFTVTVETAAPTATVAVPQGTSQLLFCDGNNNVFAPSSNAVTLNGIAAANFARLDNGGSNLTNLWQSTQAVKEQAVAFANPITLALNVGNVFYTTLTGNTTLNNPTSTPAAGYDQSFLYFLTQDATGGRTVAFQSNWLFPSGVPFTVDTTPGATTVLNCVWSATLGKVLVLSAYVGYNGTAVSGNVTIAQNTSNVSVYALVGSPVAAVNITVTINPGVRVFATTPGIPALDFSGFASGSVITLNNNGYILGCGGDGGPGGEEGKGGGTTTDLTQGGRGYDAGNAIQGPGAGNTLNINNGTGFIFGGGGGGGGGGTSPPGGSSDSNGGGGGGGAGASKGGQGGRSGAANGNNQAPNGTPGTFAVSGANGSGGTGAGGTPGAAGGNGGDWGVAGTAGANGTNTVGGAAGAAGKAVNKNSATVNFNSGGSSPNVKGAVS